MGAHEFGNRGGMPPTVAQGLSSDSGGGGSTLASIGSSQRGDYIEYMADMISELRSLADRTDCRTLAGILELAHREAMLQAVRR